MEYVLWLSLFGIIPLLVLWLCFPKVIKKYKTTLSFIAFYALVFHIPWDVYAVRTNIWSFPPGKNIGTLIWDVPIEEYFYMVFVALLGASITLIAKYKFKRK